MSSFSFPFYRGRKAGEGACLHETNSGRRSWLHSSDPHTNSIENGWSRIRPQSRRSSDSSQSRSSRYQSHSRHVRHVSLLFYFHLHGWSSSSLNEDRWNNDEREPVYVTRFYHLLVERDIIMKIFFDGPRKQQGDWPYC